jgi:hypothetical protein
MWHMSDDGPCCARWPQKHLSWPMDRYRRPTPWTPRSPDLNPFGFYLWRCLETLLYAAPVDIEEALHHRTLHACQTTRKQHGICERMFRSMMRRVEWCIESYGEHFEHLLQIYSFSYNSQLKIFRTQVNIGIFSCFGMWNSCPKFVRTFQLHSVYYSFECPK